MQQLRLKFTSAVLIGLIALGSSPTPLLGRTLDVDVVACDERAGAQTLKSAIDYCRWWSRRLARYYGPNSPERMYYLSGVRALTHVLHTPEIWLVTPELAKGAPVQQSLFPAKADGSADRWPAARRVAFEEAKGKRIPRKPIKSAHLPVKRFGGAVNA